MVIPFELHLTVDPLSSDRLGEFIDCCARHGAKPLLIELGRGEHVQQPMLGKVVYADSLELALPMARGLAEELEAEGYRVRRLKVEVPAEMDELGRAAGVYYEWHGKIRYVPGEALSRVCEKHSVHLSQNALKGEAGTRFVTLRDYAARKFFESRVRDLKDDLVREGWPVIKEVSELCIYDSNIELDMGWLDDNGSATGLSEYQLSEMLTYEAFLRRAAELDMPFMLKGSYVTRQYFANPADRIPNDLDWVYMRRLDDPQDASVIFGNWMIEITEMIENDGVVFRSFREDAFWRRIDYAMADDFPTINTDLQVKEGGVDRLLIDISFNLDIGVAPVPLLYKPLRGKPFVIPYTVPLAMQVSWKLHQTLARPRIKDLFDLMHLLRHPEFTPEVLEQTKEALRKECEVGWTDPGGMRHVVSGDWEKLFGRNIDEEWDFGCYDITNPESWPASLSEFKQQLSKALLEAGFDKDWNGVQDRRSEDVPKKRSFWDRLRGR